MKRKNSYLVAALVCILSSSIFISHAQNKSDFNFSSEISGFKFGNEVAPSGSEWQSPQQLSLNKELPHSYIFSFADKEAARKVLPENSAYYQSLNGTWKFHWVKKPDDRPKNFYEEKYDISSWEGVPVPMSWNIYGIQKDGSLKYGVPIYSNQRLIFQHQVKVDDWKGGIMRTPPKDWTTYEYPNEVGSYRRDFTVPKEWKGREVFLNFDGVDSFFYLWINGKYVGFSKNSRNVASFNVTPYLHPSGQNVVAVEVYRSSDASFLESQDMFRLPGIFRDVALTSTPVAHIRDLAVLPDLDQNYQNGTLTVNAEIINLGKKTIPLARIDYSLYENTLYSDENTLVASATMDLSSPKLTSKAKNISQKIISLSNVKKWSAEQPYRYTLVAELKDKNGKIVDVVSVYTGFRKVELKETPANQDEFGLAGKYFYVNGKTVKLKGVNRHETNPEHGKVVTRQQMEEEVILMKRANINHVRNSHYNEPAYWYYLCDKYGIYLEDEANIESHQYYYGKESLSHVPEFKDAHVARNLEMIYSNYNHPSIVIWSLGNEAGPGKNFVAAYDAIKTVDKSRPVQYERNNDIVDIGSNQYPSIDWVRGAVKGKYNIKYPFHISEYSHSMGNAVGNLIDYWEAIESTNFIMGGAIWDWIDQAMYYYDKNTGERFLAYGGDFGDKPNDGTFVNNGLIFADKTPKPQYYEVKKVSQNVGIKAVSVEKGQYEIFNKNYFTTLADYDLTWSLYKNGIAVSANNPIDATNRSFAPRQKQVVTLPYSFGALEETGEYFVKIALKLNTDKPWAKKGYVQMEEQLLVKNAQNVEKIADVAKGGKLAVTSANDLRTVKGDGFEAVFDEKSGSVYSLNYGSKTVIEPGKGPKLDPYRAPVDNDNWAYSLWYAKGLHNLKHKVWSKKMYTNPDGSVVLMYTVQSQAPNAARLRGGTSGHYVIEELKDKPFGENDFKFIQNLVWTIYKDGSIELQSGITSNDPTTNLARIGYSLELPSEYGRYTYYGRGPINNYADRKTAQNIEVHQSTVKDQFVPWPNPQNMSNNEEVRWASLTNESGNGVVFIAKDHLSTSALAYSEMELTLAPHPYQLPKSSGVHLHLDAAVTGLGGNSCGQGPPLEKDRVKATSRAISFIIRPVTQNNAEAMTHVQPSGNEPIFISRSNNGQVIINNNRTTSPVMYSINGGKAQLYTNKPFILRDAGKVSAWYQGAEVSKVVVDFEKMQNIPTTVIFASSVESGEGDAAHLVDGNPSTIWHTMYSVTVAQYPHWVDFDAGSEKIITALTYLPRQDGNSHGNIKGYRIQVSNDGKNWDKTVAEGSFSADQNLKTVRFTTPVKARYIRFMALNAQDGQDFASGAEIAILAE